MFNTVDKFWKYLNDQDKILSRLNCSLRWWSCSAGKWDAFFRWRFKELLKIDYTPVIFPHSVSEKFQQLLRIWSWMIFYHTQLYSVGNVATIIHPSAIQQGVFSPNKVKKTVILPGWRVLVWNSQPLKYTYGTWERIVVIIFLNCWQNDRSKSCKFKFLSIFFMLVNPVLQFRIILYSFWLNNETNFSMCQTDKDRCKGIRGLEKTTPTNTYCYRNNMYVFLITSSLTIGTGNWKNKMVQLVGHECNTRQPCIIP